MKRTIHLNNQDLIEYIAAVVKHQNPGVQVDEVRFKVTQISHTQGEFRAEVTVEE